MVYFIFATQQNTNIEPTCLHLSQHSNFFFRAFAIPLCNFKTVIQLSFSSYYTILSTLSPSLVGSSLRFHYMLTLHNTPQPYTTNQHCYDILIIFPTTLLLIKKPGRCDRLSLYQCSCSGEVYLPNSIYQNPSDPFQTSSVLSQIHDPFRPSLSDTHAVLFHAGPSLSHVHAAYLALLSVCSFLLSLIPAVL